MLAHYAVRWLFHQGATGSGQADHDLSFTAHTQLLRREQPGCWTFPPSASAATGSVAASGTGATRQATLRAHA